MIYEVPFNEIEILTTLLEELQAQFGERCYIDIEMNSLEDAYLRIAREEEKLLAAMKASEPLDNRASLIASHNHRISPIALNTELANFNTNIQNQSILSNYNEIETDN